MAGIRQTVQWRAPLTAMKRVVLEVVRAYRRAQRRIVRSWPRNMSREHLALAIFAVERSASESLAQRMVAWLAAHPKWSYTTVSNFGRDLNEAVRRLT